MYFNFKLNAENINQIKIRIIYYVYFLLDEEKKEVKHLNVT